MNVGLQRLRTYQLKWQTAMRILEEFTKKMKGCLMKLQATCQRYSVKWAISGLVNYSTSRRSSHSSKALYHQQRHVLAKHGTRQGYIQTTKCFPTETFKSSKFNLYERKSATRQDADSIRTHKSHLSFKLAALRTRPSLVWSVLTTYYICIRYLCPNAFVNAYIHSSLVLMDVVEVKIINRKFQPDGKAV